MATQLCVFTDLTLVADDARIGEPTVPIGGGFIAPVWSTLVGPKRAKELAFVPGNSIDGATAVAWGWANHCVPADRLVATVPALAERIATVPPEVLRVKKLSINRAAEAEGERAFCVGADVSAGAERPSRMALGGGLMGVGGPLVTLTKPLIAAGRGYALAMIRTGERIKAEEAQRYGLVNEVVGDDKLAEATARWADKTLAASPRAVQAAKAAALGRLGLPLEIALATRFEPIENYASSQDRLEGRKAFAEKRPPNWQGR